MRLPIVLLMVLAAAACAPAGAGSADALFSAPLPRDLTVHGPFPEGGMVPAPYTCDGEGISPPLAWEGAPEGTVELAVVVDDPDAPAGTYVHWVVFGLPAGLESLEAGMVPSGARQAEHSGGGRGYLGPCPPQGAEHTYRFAVYALGTRLEVADGAAPEVALDAIREAAIGSGLLTGRFRRG